MLDGTVIGECMPRHRHCEFLRFLKTIDERTPPNLDLHLIVDNYATHKTPAVKRWLKRHPRFRPNGGATVFAARGSASGPERRFAAAQQDARNGGEADGRQMGAGCSQPSLSGPVPRPRTAVPRCAMFRAAWS
jgi:hypothetical protein